MNIFADTVVMSNSYTSHYLKSRKLEMVYIQRAARSNKPSTCAVTAAVKPHIS